MRPLYRQFDHQTQIDTEYNPSLRVADAQALGQHYADQALKARITLRNVLNVPFGPTLDETLDIFPADAPNAPVFVFIHGGYWRALSSKEFSGVALGLQPLGITTVVANYALAPRVSLDEITRQTRAARVGHHIHIGQRLSGLGQHLFGQRQHAANVVAAGQLWHHAAIGLVHLDLAVQRVR